ncbi:MAG: GAF and ANTAR domain-containing protein, partial [Actinomycetota bacterium]|nr:GAF and ANTAR domain-containing protein [Actinomycetota bacterium]
MSDDSMRPRATGGSLGPEEVVGDGSLDVGDSGPHDAGLRGVAAIPASSQVIDGALRLVVRLAAATVGGADGVSVSLERHGQLTTVAASDETILQMDHDQYATGQGPCVAAAREGHWFHVESLDDETRWPDFTPRAIAGGIHSILSTPLLAATGPVGALNIYSKRNKAFGGAEQDLAALFATQASGILIDAGADVPSPEVAARLDQALRAREVIAQAQGVIMERHG